MPASSSGRLLQDLARRFKDRGVLRLCQRIIELHQASPGRGLPIGALTSQHFANLYLAPLDRWLLEHWRVGGMVRYMDDTLWWGARRSVVREQLHGVIERLVQQRGLTVKPTWQLGQSVHGVPFCGFRVLRGALRLSSRRRRRYRRARQRWESAYRGGVIDAPMLQRGYASALAITAHAHPSAWRREELLRRPAPEA